MSEVRVRFAPSPTGKLHIGGLRTALFNYLFAKANNGKLILRIEDTDRERLVEGALDNIIDCLNHYGVIYDEGPDKEGDFGPYVQSQRLDLYKKHIDQLLDEEKAYRCFCSSEVLDEMREKQKKAGQKTRYDGRCRRLSKEEVKANIDAGKSFSVRMKLDYTKMETEFRDIVREVVVIKTNQLEDQIILKSDGFPTYHFANVVDDHYMGITHVIRGEEWLPSTPKHIILYKFLGWEEPQFAHLPLLLNSDRSKLSKRQGDVAADAYLEKGYLPAAMVNFIALLGWNDGSVREFFTMDELIGSFSMDRVGKSGAVFDLKKLDWMNKHYISELSPEELSEAAMPFLEEEYRNTDKDKLLKALAIVQPGVEVLTQLNNKLRLLLGEGKDVELDDMTKSPDSVRVYKSFVEHAEQFSGEWSEESFKTIMKTVQKETGIKGKDLWKPMRWAITLEGDGPELPIFAEFAGKEECLRRVSQLCG